MVTWSLTKSESATSLKVLNNENNDNPGEWKFKI